ncbi:MAG: glucose-1-phosphate adenylyltransferase subunit GlgD, partial [Clostridiales bacterium]|nr:glucose-1-phosphate adenylyltransferase subunit GlgD [Clostridiales bacterium]
RGLVSWERDIIQQGVHLGYRIYGWEFKGYAGQIGSMRDYYRISMDILDLDVREELFYRHGHVFTKVRDEVPAKYGEKAQVSDSCVADGCIIDGIVDHSVIFRDVRIGACSHINNSIIMQGARIGKNVKLDCVIVDKDVYINDNRTLIGFLTHPIYIKKSSII